MNCFFYVEQKGVHIEHHHLVKWLILQKPEDNISDGLDNVVETTWAPQTDLLREITPKRANQQDEL